MIFERLTVENFRQYFGRQRLEFTRDKKRKVTIIHGVNGAGKTSLFLAINWCLYGSSYVSNVGELISKKAVNEGEVSDYINMSVELSFLHEGERFIVKRTKQGIKMIDGSVSNDDDGFTMVRMHGDGQSERVKNSIGRINSILPSNVRTYFLFDGEKIDDFAKPESAKQVKEAIYLIFKLEILDRARDHLETTARDYRKELKAISSLELHSLVVKNENIRADLSANEKRTSELKQEIISTRSKISDIDKQLRGIQSVKVLQQRRDSIERDLKHRKIDLDDLINHIRDLTTSAYFTLTQTTVNSALKILNKKRERGEIPFNIRQQFVQDLISQMVCICGRSFTEGSSEHLRLLSLIASVVPDSLGDDIFRTNAELSDFAQKGSTQQMNIMKLIKRRVEVVDLIKDLEAELSDVRFELKGSPLEEVSGLEKQRQNFTKDIEDNTLEIGVISERIERATKDIVQLEKDLFNAKKSEQKEKLVSTKLYLAQQAADAIKVTYNAYADEMRVEVEKKAKEVFKSLIWKDSSFQDVCLDTDFNLEVIDQYGKHSRAELSAGERQVLSLAFITAMSRISGEEAPLVMDTPFGRLSSEHRSNVAEHLPLLADQLVLLITDEELHGDALTNLRPYIGAEYYLNFDNKTNFTEIREK